MALDATTEKLFCAADASTLLALLPLLRSQIEQARAELERVERHQKNSADSDAKLAETYGEALAKFHTRIGDDPEARESLRALRDKVNAALGRLREHDERTAQHVDDLFRHLVELTQRERWIVDEMKRRGYLPLFPGEDLLSEL
ncbi:hypothetical protein GCM10010191_75800 [Actinomadura vinacea]|uniref:Uncharacterized protein n=1 Tax=Actinomadura vinacea TaxID=115336 RepID=A0ABP5X7Y4_9ACTN